MTFAREDEKLKSPQRAGLAGIDVLTNFLYQVPVLSFIKDDAGRYLFCNQSFFSFFNVEQECVIGKTDFDWLPHDLALQFTTNDDRVRDTGEAVEVIESVDVPGHGVVRSVVHKFPIPNTGSTEGKCYVGGIAVDIEDRLRASELRAQLAAIVDSSHDAIIGATTTCQITTWNSGACRLFGYSREEALGKSLLDLIPTDKHATMKKLIEDLRSGRAIDQYESLTVHKSGAQTHTSITLSPVLSDMDVVVGLSMVARDITKRTEMEAQLRGTTEELALARDQALEASNLKSAFVANISHELRTPLSGVLGMLELLLETDLNAEQRYFANTIQISAQSLLSIVRDILDLSKIEANKLTFDCIAFDLNTVIQECRALMGAQAEQKNIKFNVNVDGNLPQRLYGDPERIRQILVNLLNNAIKFTEQGEVNLGCKKVSEDADTVTIKVTVQDTGIGIAEEEQRFLFLPFTQVDGSASRKYGGTGLGLSICKKLLEMLNGDIGVSSTKNSGTLFWFTLPLHKNQPQPQVAKGEESSPVKGDFAGKHILVVEDNQVLRTLALRQLQNIGIQAQAVCSGREAIDATKGFAFDLILMDCHLMDIDGFDATVAIREMEASNETGKRIPIIALTAGGQSGERERCLEVGMDDYLCKPVSIQELSKKVNYWLTHGSKS